MMSSLPCMPSVRARRRGASSSTSPSPMLNQPSARPSWSAVPRELGPVLSIFGSPSERVTLEMCFMDLSPGSGLQHDLDATVLLVTEHFVHLRSLVEADRVRN